MCPACYCAHHCLQLQADPDADALSRSAKVWRNFSTFGAMTAAQ
jgi:hypothetical protein